MIKKIMIISVILMASVLFLYPVNADDGGSEYDDGKLLSFTFDAIQKEAKIGEEFTFKITITNHTAYYISNLIFSQILDAQSYAWRTVDKSELGIPENGNTSISIDPYKTVEYEITYIVPEEINWIKDGDYYYVNLSPILDYSAIDDDYIDETGTPWNWDFINGSGGSIPIELANLYDGSEYMNITITDDINTIEYKKQEDNTSHIYGGMLEARVRAYIALENKSEYKMENINIRWQNEGKSDLVDYLNINKTVDFVFHGHLYENIENIGRNESIIYKVLYTADNKYYAASVERIYSTVICDDNADGSVGIITEEIYEERLNEDENSDDIIIPNEDIANDFASKQTPEKIVEVQLVKEYVVPVWVWVILVASIIGIAVAYYIVWLEKREKK